jgi:hypothetical protein
MINKNTNCNNIYNIENVTILQHKRKYLHKKFYFENGKVYVKKFPNVKYFESFTYNFSSITDIWDIIDELSNNNTVAIIRGINNNSENHYIQKTKEYFFEPPNGSEWVMLDVDGFEIPENIDNCSTEGIEYFIENHLPTEFCDTSYVYQFSNSAGILKENGKLFKDGLVVHLYFYLNKKLTNFQLKQWLEEYPVDKKLFNPVQFHIIANPDIDNNVKCIIKNRQGIVKKVNDTVDISKLDITPTKQICNTKPNNFQSNTVTDIEKWKLIDRLNDVGCIFENKISDISVNIFHTDEIKSKGSWCIFFDNPDSCYHPTGEWMKLDVWLEKYWDVGNELIETSVENKTVKTKYNAIQAKFKLKECIRNFNKYRNNTVIKASSGLGKSTEVISQLFKKSNKIHYLVKTHDLANELYDKIIKQYPYLNGIVFKGRSNEGMCKKAIKYGNKKNVVEELSKKGYSIYSNLCHKNYSDKVIQCEFYNDCPYLSQFISQQQYDYDFVILTHDVLVNNEIKNSPLLTLKEPDFVVVDESFWQKFHGKFKIPLSEIRSYLLGNNISDIEKKILKVIHDSTTSTIPLLKLLRDNGISEDDLHDAMLNSRSTKSKINLNPDSNGDDLVNECKRIKKRPNLSILFESLLIEFDKDRDICHSVNIDHTNRFLQINCRKELNKYHNVPFLIIDSDSDQTLIEKVLNWNNNDYDFFDIDVKRKSFITQVKNKTFSKNSLTRKNNGDVYDIKVDQLINDVNGFIEIIASKNKKVLVIIYMKIVKEIKPFKNVDVIYWNSFRGLDCYKDYDVVIAIGRNEPHNQQLESIMRGIFFDDDKQLDFIKKNNQGVKLFNSSNRPIHLKNNRSFINKVTIHPVDVSIHPDQRGNRILNQIRECETIQGISRIRDIHNNGKKVYILCNVPLDLEIDKLIDWKDLKKGGDKIDLMFDQIDWQKEILPLDPKFCLEKFNHIWKNENQYNYYISRKSDQYLFDKAIQSINCNSVIIYYITRLQLIKFRIQGIKGCSKRCISGFNVEKTKLMLEDIYGRRVNILNNDLQYEFEEQITFTTYLNDIFSDTDRMQNDLNKVLNSEMNYKEYIAVEVA